MYFFSNDIDNISNQLIELLLSDIAVSVHIHWADEVIDVGKGRLLNVEGAGYLFYQLRKLVFG